MSFIWVDYVTLCLKNCNQKIKSSPKCLWQEIVKHIILGRFRQHIRRHRAHRFAHFQLERLFHLVKLHLQFLILLPQLLIFTCQLDLFKRNVMRVSQYLFRVKSVSIEKFRSLSASNCTIWEFFFSRHFFAASRFRRRRFSTLASSLLDLFIFSNLCSFLFVPKCYLL